ncbi:MAG: serine hydrolase [Rhodovarius sp.]|nr:serine hydrolase [Rhodovarius sp.]
MTSRRSRPHAGRRTGLLVVAALLLLAGLPARADITRRDNYAAIVVDARGQTLLAENADAPRFPASLTKMMTLYMVFEALRERRLTMSSRISMSEEAASRPPSKLGIGAGGSLTVEAAILALITRSANDVAAAVAEHLAGSEERFAQLMTQRARALGMSRTTFRNASGLPDPEQLTTARDMALLGRRLLLDFPQYAPLFATTHFEWGGRVIHNHNHMLSAYQGADGIKTGFTRASGFNIVTTAQRDGVRLVGVVMGGSSWLERDRHMAELLDQAFARLGVAPRPNSYDASLTNRGAARQDAQGSAAGRQGGPRLAAARPAAPPPPAGTGTTARLQEGTAAARPVSTRPGQGRPRPAASPQPPAQARPQASPPRQALPRPTVQAAPATPTPRPIRSGSPEPARVGSASRI